MQLLDPVINPIFCTLQSDGNAIKLLVIPISPLEEIFIYGSAI